jgi:hypothetical protein
LTTGAGGARGEIVVGQQKRKTTKQVRVLWGTDQSRERELKLGEHIHRAKVKQNVRGISPHLNAPVLDCACQSWSLAVIQIILESIESLESNPYLQEAS